MRAGQGTPTFQLFPDLPLVLDSTKFAFRNDKQGAGPCAKVGCMWGQLCYYFANHTLRPESCQAHPDASRQAGGSCLAGTAAGAWCRRSRGLSPKRSASTAPSGRLPAFP